MAERRLDDISRLVHYALSEVRSEFVSTSGLQGIIQQTREGADSFGGHRH